MDIFSPIRSVCILHGTTKNLAKQIKTYMDQITFTVSRKLFFSLLSRMCNLIICTLHLVYSIVYYYGWKTERYVYIKSECFEKFVLRNALFLETKQFAASFQLSLIFSVIFQDIFVIYFNYKKKWFCYIDFIVGSNNRFMCFTIQYTVQKNFLITL